MVFLGYDEITMGYRCLDHTTIKIIISRDVKFIENQIGIPNMLDKPSNLDTILKAFLDQNQVPTEPPLPHSTAENRLHPHHLQTIVKYATSESYSTCSITNITTLSSHRLSKSKSTTSSDKSRTFNSDFIHLSAF